ncbi:MAG TPA: LacI family DNA-binding transcriptional regulator [Steroidobacteraceae bacterium]|nr:LacI family DNA-binding transcriptional regulator [Steroidobacteraceae bacterium]
MAINIPPASVTIQEVADLAKVSPKTVSRVINNEPRVRSDTRARILEAIETLNYRPNLNARGLASNRSFLIGLFCEKPGDYLSEFQAGAVARCRESSLHLMVEPWDVDSPMIDRQIDTLLGQLRLEGVILLPPLSDHPVVLKKLHEASIPIVRIAPKNHLSRTPSIGIDDYAAARQITSHLASLGHRRIGFMLGRPEHGATEQRYRGFVDEMRDRQLAIDSDLVQTGNFVFGDGLLCAERMLRAAAPPTAIFASNDDMAAAAISMARKIGLDLPGQLSVAGFDDAPVASMIWPELTTVRQPVSEMARIAADLIIQLEPRRNGWPERIPRQLLAHELVIRNSTARPARRK